LKCLFIIIIVVIAVVACLSHASIVSKQIKISSNFFLSLVAPSLWFSNTRYGCEILTGRGACHSGGLRFFSQNHLTMAVLERVADTFSSLRTPYRPIAPREEKIIGKSFATLWWRTS